MLINILEPDYAENLMYSTIADWSAIVFIVPR